MTEVKKFAWSGLIVALALGAALVMLVSPAKALTSLNLSPNVVNVGDQVTATATGANVPGGSLFPDGSVLFEILAGPGTGTAVFAANGLTTLNCVQNAACDTSAGVAIAVTINTTGPGQVGVRATGHNSSTFAPGSPTGADHASGPITQQLTILGSGGALLTLSAKDSIGRPNDVTGWTGPGAPFDETSITVNAKDTNGNNIGGILINFATVGQVAPNNLLLDGSHGPASCVTNASGNCSVLAETINTTPYGIHTVSAATTDGGFVGGATVDIMVAKPPVNVQWIFSNSTVQQGAATSQNVRIFVSDEDGRRAWTGLGVLTDSGDGSFGFLNCVLSSISMGNADCTYLAPGIPQTVILGVNIGSKLVSTHQLQIVAGPTPVTGNFNPVPVAGGLTITVYDGTVASLIHDGGTLNLVSCFATIGGNFVGHIFGGPAFVNTAFATAFAGGLDEQGLICRRA